MSTKETKMNKNYLYLTEEEVDKLFDEVSSKYSGMILHRPEKLTKEDAENIRDGNIKIKAPHRFSFTAKR